MPVLGFDKLLDHQ